MTGGFGFLGSRIAQHFSLGLEEVVILTRDNEIIKNSIVSSNVKPAYINVNNLNSLKQLAKKVDVVIHAAGPNRADCELNPAQQRASNVALAKNLASLLLKEGNLRRFINLSSVSVYGETLDGMITEVSAEAPTSAYGNVKLAVEKALTEQFSKFGCSDLLTNVRISNGFGYSADYCKTPTQLQPFINQIVDQAKRTQTIVIQNNPLIKKDFVSCLKICDIIQELVYSEEPTPRLLNLSSGTTRSLESVCLLISNAMRDVNLSFRYLQKSEETPTFTIPCNFLTPTHETDEDYFSEEFTAMVGS